MKKKRVGEVVCDNEATAQFYLTDITLVYPNKEPRLINYADINFIQEMFVEEKKKFLLGLYLRNPAATKVPSLTFGDFSDTKGFLEAFYSVKNCIPNFEKELKGFFGNLLASRQKPRRCELGFDHQHFLVRQVEDEQEYFYRTEINACKVEEIPNQNIIKVSLLQSQLEVVNFTRKEDVFTFKKFMFKAIEESTKEHAVIYDDIEDIDKFKIFILESSPFLKNLHEKIVLSGTMNEQEFWESRHEYKEYKKYFIENKQKLGKITGLLIKDKALSKEDKPKILTQYPEVKVAYFNEVMDGDNFNHEKDRKFWDEFMKLQLLKDTEIVGGKNPVAIPSSNSSMYQYADPRRTEISDVPLGDVDLSRNLDVKTNVAEKLMYETLKEHYGNAGSSKNDIESTIKKFQVHGLNVLGGIKPVANFQGTNFQGLMDEFKDLLPDSLGVPEEMQVNTVKITHHDPNSAHRGSAEERMAIENVVLQKTSDGKTAKSNSDAIGSKLQKLLENRSELKERKKNSFNRSEMQNIFKELVQASIQKEETIESSQFREAYEGFHDQAKDLLRLFYSIGISDDNATENKRKTMKDLINELIGKINIYLNESEKELKRHTIAPGTQDKGKEGVKLNKAMETILEMLKFAVSSKE